MNRLKQLIYSLIENLHVRINQLIVASNLLDLIILKELFVLLKQFFCNKKGSPLSGVQFDLNSINFMSCLEIMKLLETIIS